MYKIMKWKLTGQINGDAIKMGVSDVYCHVSACPVDLTQICYASSPLFATKRSKSGERKSIKTFSDFLQKPDCIFPSFFCYVFITSVFTSSLLLSTLGEFMPE